MRPETVRIPSFPTAVPVPVDIPDAGPYRGEIIRDSLNASPFGETETMRPETPIQSFPTAIPAPVANPDSGLMTVENFITGPARAVADNPALFSRPEQEARAFRDSLLAAYPERVATNKDLINFLRDLRESADKEMPSQADFKTDTGISEQFVKGIADVLSADYFDGKPVSRDDFIFALAAAGWALDLKPADIHKDYQLHLSGTIGSKAGYRDPDAWGDWARVVTADPILEALSNRGLLIPGPIQESTHGLVKANNRAYLLWRAHEVNRGAFIPEMWAQMYGGYRAGGALRHLGGRAIPRFAPQITRYPALQQAGGPAADIIGNTAVDLAFSTLPGNSATKRDWNVTPREFLRATLTNAGFYYLPNLPQHITRYVTGSTIAPNALWAGKPGTDRISLPRLKAALENSRLRPEDIPAARAELDQLVRDAGRRPGDTGLYRLVEEGYNIPAFYRDLHNAKGQATLGGQSVSYVGPETGMIYQIKPPALTRGPLPGAVYHASPTIGKVVQETDDITIPFFTDIAGRRRFEPADSRGNVGQDRAVVARDFPKVHPSAKIWDGAIEASENVTPVGNTFDIGPSIPYGVAFRGLLPYWRRLYIDRGLLPTADLSAAALRRANWRGLLDGLPLPGRTPAGMRILGPEGVPLAPPQGRPPLTAAEVVDESRRLRNVAADDERLLSVTPRGRDYLTILGQRTAAPPVRRPPPPEGRRPVPLPVRTPAPPETRQPAPPETRRPAPEERREIPPMPERRVPAPEERREIPPMPERRVPAPEERRAIPPMPERRVPAREQRAIPPMPQPRFSLAERRAIPPMPEPRIPPPQPPRATPPEPPRVPPPEPPRATPPQPPRVPPPEPPRIPPPEPPRIPPPEPPRVPPPPPPRVPPPGSPRPNPRSPQGEPAPGPDGTGEYPAVVEWTGEVKHTLNLHTGQYDSVPVSERGPQSARIVETRPEPTPEALHRAAMLQIKAGPKGNVTVKGINHRRRRSKKSKRRDQKIETLETPRIRYVEIDGK